MLRCYGCTVPLPREDLPPSTCVGYIAVLRESTRSAKARGWLFPPSGCVGWVQTTGVATGIDPIPFASQGGGKDRCKLRLCMGLMWRCQGQDSALRSWLQL